VFQKPALCQSSTGFTDPQRDETKSGDSAANLLTRHPRLSGGQLAEFVCDTFSFGLFNLQPNPNLVSF
jgi:hypothetical protein